MLKYIYKIKEAFFPDRRFRRARIWSNNELEKIALLFVGDIINVSGWKDDDKKNKKYREYFTNAKSYSISNYGGDMGYQGKEGEILLDLEKDLDEKYISKYDVVFNHTTLEHIFEINTAFKNLCLMSRDIVIIVVPFLQQMHFSDSYKDYWRFTPFAVKKMFEKNGMSLIYLNANDGGKESVYLFAVGSKDPNKWKDKINYINESVFKNLGENIF